MRFTIRDLLWLTVVVGLTTGWWLREQRLHSELERAEVWRGRAGALDPRVRFAGISGMAVVPAGETSVVLKPGVEIDDQTFVLISPTENLHENALWYTKQGGNQEILIHLNSSRSNDTNVAYLILEHA